ncbi:hypothetical protein ACMU6081_25310 [Achromobacter mucicolens]|uniref:Uncharacterized protein n=1 Tax=Achromobacter mucicolens TaxID=1389922 RepID=A0ABM8LIQ0_9BURK|nr:hypothetical protein LMG3415_04411 [Achromobacter mucicolens]
MRGGRPRKQNINVNRYFARALGQSRRPARDQWRIAMVFRDVKPYSASKPFSRP